MVASDVVVLEICAVAPRVNENTTGAAVYKLAVHHCDVASARNPHVVIQIVVKVGTINDQVGHAISDTDGTESVVVSFDIRDVDAGCILDADAAQKARNGTIQNIYIVEALDKDALSAVGRPFRCRTSSCGCRTNDFIASQVDGNVAGSNGQTDTTRPKAAAVQI